MHALEAAGAVATCNPGGAGKWRDEFSPSFRGASVVVIADRDNAGRAHAERVRSSLAAAGVPAQVVEPAAGNDAADHLSAGLGVGHFTPIELPADAEHPAHKLAELWALPKGVSIRRARITERGQAVSAASVDVELSNGETIHFERQSDMVRPSTVALEVAARTGAVPALKTADALRAVGHLRALAEHEVAFDADSVAEAWGVAYLQSAPTRHVAMASQAERWRAFCDLERMDPVGGRAEGLTIPQASVVLVGEADGTRYVRAGWFRAYVHGEDASLSPQELAHRMRRVGWAQRGRRGKRGRIKATRPGGGASLAWSFYKVPKGWGE